MTAAAQIEEGLRKESDMYQLNLLTDERRLFEELCTIERLRGAFSEREEEQWKPRVDGVTIAEFEARLDEELGRLKAELDELDLQTLTGAAGGNPQTRWARHPQARGANGARPGRASGPQAMLEPIFEPTFSDNSYGFRPGRSQQQAVEAAREIVAGGKPYVVDLDLEQFFDRIHHDRLIARVGEQIPDKRILRLIGMTLRSGVMADGLISPTTRRNRARQPT
jgi:RNA-directed DNA polymerase